MQSSDFIISPYKAEFATLWDDFVDRARNATFIMKRPYADYHADRFTDASLIIFRDGRAAALFLASSADTTVTAHKGLTYGGLILPQNGVSPTEVVKIMTLIANHYRSLGFTELIYKHLPHIYPLSPADEPLYALFRLGAQISEINLSTAIDLSDPHAPAPNPKTRRRYQHAAAKGLIVSDSTDYAAFWQILTDTLQSRHNATPVHSLDEITLLASRFPDNIRLVTVTDPATGQLLAGSVLYITDSVIHAQYTASTPEGRQLDAVHFLYLSIRNRFEGQHRWLDFGISNEDHGQILNDGLINQKWNYGARPIAHTILRLPL